MPVGYLVSTALIAVCTWCALFPLRGPATVTYWLGMVLNELPFVALYALAASTVLALAQGDVHSPAGWAVVALAAATTAGLAVLVLRAGPTRDLPWVHLLLAPLRVRRGDVHRVADLSYGPAGRRNLLDVYHRRDRPVGGPVLVYAHGGRFRSGRKNREGLLLLHRLAAEGWICLSVDYRLAPQASYPDFHEDYALAVVWARARAGEYGGDPSTLFVAGSSAGAHLAAMTALTDPTVAGALCFYGYFGRVDASPSSAPSAHLRPDAPPFFVAHGDGDSVVPVASARAFVEELTHASEHGVRYVELPGAQHSFDLFCSIRNERVVRQAVDFTRSVRARRAERPQAG